MRKTFLSFFLLLCTYWGFGQQDSLNFFVGNHPRFLTQFNDTLPNAFAGGFKNPQFNNIDLNLDGKKDLVIYDGVDHRLLPFIKSKDGSNNSQKFTYAPRYEEAFPQGNKFMALLTRDYNGDGKKDLFYVKSSSSLSFYRNISDSTLKFRRIKKEIMTKTPEPPDGKDTLESRIFVGRTDIPGIADVDFDGDLDIMAYNIGGGYLSYYRNYADEIANPKPDSFYYILEDRCWGCFQESGGSSNLPSIKIDCNGYPRVGKRHSGSNILPLELDGDKDMDLVYGDVGFSNLVYLINGRKQNNHPIDSFTKAFNGFPSNTKPAEMRDFLAPFKVDVNGDSLYDLVITPQAEVAGKSKNQTWYYKNTGTRELPEFKFQKKDFLQETMVDLGDRSAPAFFDYDGDGTQDLLVATSGDYEKTTNSYNYLMLYENQGSAEKPVFKPVSTNYLTLKKDSLIGLKPAIGDLDGDNDKDLLLGNAEGRLIYFENTASSGEKASFKKRTTFLDSIDVGRSSAPTIGDVDGDGLNDILVGTEFRKLCYFKHQGMKNGLPEFKKVTKKFGKIHKKRKTFLAPRLADLDQNDSLDLILGTKRKGHLKFYWNFQKNLGDSFRADNQVVKVDTSDSEKARFLGNNLYPAVSNLDNDSFPDILMGNARGGLVYLGSQFSYDTISSPGLGIQVKQGSKPEFRFYPNPVKSQLFLEISMEGYNAEQLTLELYNNKGQLVKQSVIPGKSQLRKLNISSLGKGVYIAVIKDNKNGKQLGKEKVLKRN